mgnify:CR=1 FL=1
MGFIRNEALHLMKFYWEGALGLLIILLGIKLIFSIFWLRIIFGFLLICLGIVIILNFLKRYITSIKQESLGYLSVKERQVSYNHPTDSGVISLDSLSVISLVKKAEGSSIPQSALLIF